LHVLLHGLELGGVGGLSFYWVGVWVGEAVGGVHCVFTIIFSFTLSFSVL
jgi:hypothetical protein